MSERGMREDERYVPCAETSIWREPHGYWSARVHVDMPERREWRASATKFHDTDEAMEWARLQIVMATERVPNAR